MTINRSALLAVLGAIIISIFCIIGAVISFVTGWQLTFSAYVMSLAVVFAFRLLVLMATTMKGAVRNIGPVSYTHLRAHETPEHLVCRLLLEKKKKQKTHKT